MADSSKWPMETLEPLLSEFHIISTQRGADDVEKLLCEEGSLLNKYRDRIYLVADAMENSISSSAVRKLISESRSVKYIVPDEVIEYLTKYNVYQQ